MVSSPARALAGTSGADWDRLYALVFDRARLDLHSYKRSYVQRRLEAMLAARRLTTLPEIIDLASASEADMEWLVDGLSVNVSELFRDPARWRELTDRHLPDLVAASGSLRCWSAGCSIGAEAATLAIILDLHHPGDHTILGTDIDAAALARARAGEFTTSEMRFVETGVRAKYFSHRYATDTWALDRSLHGRLDFSTGNLLSDAYGEDFDLIVCRNVAIYMTDAAQDHLFSNFFGALRSGGLLFTGATESLFYAHQLGFELVAPSLYRKSVA